jgi:hypothetical protein
VTTNYVYSSPFAGIKTESQLNADVANAGKALALAKQMGMPEYIHESTIVQAYVNSLKALYGLRGLVRTEGILVSDRYKAGSYFRLYQESFQKAMDTLPKWENVVDGEFSGANTADEIKQLKEMQQQMKATALELDIPTAD